MALIGGTLGYRLLRAIRPTGDTELDGSAYTNTSKLDVLLGDPFWEEVRDRTVIDFGCGTGSESIEMAQKGAARVIGLDIRDTVLEQARSNARRQGAGDTVRHRRRWRRRRRGRH